MNGFKGFLALGAVCASAYAVYVAIFLDPQAGKPERTDIPAVEAGPPMVDVGPPGVGFGEGPPTGAFGIPGRSESVPPVGGGVPPLPGAGPRSVSLSPSAGEPPPVSLSPFDARDAEPVPPTGGLASPSSPPSALPGGSSLAGSSPRTPPALVLPPPVAALSGRGPVPAAQLPTDPAGDFGPPSTDLGGSSSGPPTAMASDAGKPASGSLYSNPFASAESGPSSPPAAAPSRLPPPAVGGVDSPSSPLASASPAAGDPPAAPVSLQPAFAVAAPLMEKGELKEALETLSPQYEWNPAKNLSPAEAEELYHKLDQLAGSVIYSRQPWLGEYVTVKPTDTLETLAADHRVPWRLLGKINGIAYPDQVQPGDKIKIVPGPFDALVDLSRRRITLRVAGLYAGRFQFDLGAAGSLAAGKYEVVSKREPSNAPGGARVFWIDLGRGASIYGPSDEKVELGVRTVEGGIQLAARDIEDVFDILSVGSEVEIVGSAAPQAASSADPGRSPLR